jgi:hypothetical protein
MVAADNGQLREPCPACGHRYFKRPTWAPWKLTTTDCRFLRSVRIAAVDEWLELFRHDGGHP